ncbi:MAG TPA: DNA translocase FtsK 4TM domain-containing protein [Candidatus Gracilibacteria bacterium]
MFGKKKKSPSVKIPATVLRREAQKMAKQILKKEELKEREQLRKDKIKSKAKAKADRSKEKSLAWDEFYEGHLEREIWGGIWIFLGIILIALQLSDASLATTLTRYAQTLMGVGIWVVPVFFVSIGVTLFLQKESLFPPARIMALVFFMLFLLGGISLFVPLEDSLDKSHEYGGAIGFALGFFPRTYLGDGVTWVGLIAGLWFAAIVGIGVTVRDIINLFKGKGISIKGQADDKSASKKEVILSPEEQKHKRLQHTDKFKNELEIVDSTKGGSSSKSLEIEEEDELTAAKNQSFGDNPFEPPSLDLLNDAHSTITVNEAELRAKAEGIREKLEQFGLEVIMKSVHVGPTVTQFTLEPSAGVKLNKITALKNDLALALAAPSLRIEAPIRGKKLVGIEIPNTDRSVVSMREILESDAWENSESPLSLVLGRDVAGKPMVADLQKMPHLLIAGKTGSGKSVGMNAFLISILWRNTPEDLRLILIDPKRVELKPYDHLPHLLTPVITEPEKAVSALAWAVAEMNRRYRKLSETGVRNLEEYNKKHSGEKEPYIVIVIDELADLMMTAGKDVEAAVCRIAQMARAVGMHLIIATQRPSVDVVTGLIKANLPARMAFRVNSGIDSRTIIDGIGAEDLLGFGDMLSLDGNSGDLTRIQGVYLSTEEVVRVTNHIKIQFPEMILNDEITKQSIEGMAKGGVLTAGVTDNNIADEDLDDRFEEAVDLVIETGKASASFLQRRLEVGYARAARMLDQMEAKGIIGPSRGAKAREIYGRQG